MASVPYASAIGSLMYAMVCTRPDLAYAVGLLSRFQSDPRIPLWNAVKRVMRYLVGIVVYTLCHGGSFHGRKKHIEIKYQFIRNKKDEVQLSYMPTGDMVADPLTKLLAVDLFHKHVKAMGLRRW